MDGRDNLARVQKGTPAEQKAAIDAGRKVAQFCANCHGEQAGARYAELPNLAGQHPLYLLNQIEVFRTGRRAGARSPLGCRHRATDTRRPATTT